MDVAISSLSLCLSLIHIYIYIHTKQDALEGVGYNVSVRVYNSASLLPQHRERVFLACILRSHIPRDSNNNNSDPSPVPCMSWPILPAAGEIKVREILDSRESIPSDLYLSDRRWSKVYMFISLSLYIYISICIPVRVIRVISLVLISLFLSLNLSLSALSASSERD